MATWGSEGTGDPGRGKHTERFTQKRRPSPTSQGGKGQDRRVPRTSQEGDRGKERAIWTNGGSLPCPPWQRFPGEAWWAPPLSEAPPCEAPASGRRGTTHLGLPAGSWRLSLKRHGCHPLLTGLLTCVWLPSGCLISPTVWGRPHPISLAVTEARVALQGDRHGGWWLLSVRGEHGTPPCTRALVPQARGPRVSCLFNLCIIS